MKLKLQIYLYSFFLIFLFSFNCLASSPSDYFRSKQSGAFNLASTWESSADNINWINANLIPTAASKGVDIRNGHTVLISSSIVIDDFVVSIGGVLTINTNGSLNIINSAAFVDCAVYGQIINSGSFASSGRLEFFNGSKYIHAFTTTDGRIPPAIWDDGSNCEISGYTTSNTGPRLFDDFQSFYNFTWNCTNQQINSFPALTARLNVRNNFNVLSTGQGALRMFYTTASVNHFVNNYIQTGGIVDMLYTTNASNLITNLYISGNFSLINGTFRKSSANVTNTTALIFNGTSIQNFTKTGGTFTGAINFIVNPNAIVDFGNSIISGNTGTFKANANSTLITSNSGGFALTGATGTVQSTGTRTYPTTANYTYNGTTQNTGNGLPATVNNLTIDNNSAVTLRTGSINVNGAFTINSGSLDLGTNLLTTPTSVGFTGNGTLYTQNISATPLQVSKTWGGTVAYNSSSPQTIVNGDYTNLNGTGGNRTLSSLINIAGDFIPGTPSLYTITGSTVNFNGTGPQNIPTFDFNNLSASNNGTKTVTGDATVLNTLQVNDAAVINGNGNLTLLATATKNANVAPLSGSADIIGNIKVQSYLYGEPSGAKRGTKSMSSPINDAAVAGAKTFQQLKNYVIISGPGGTANGFDAGPGPVPTFNPVTLNFYNESASPSVTSFISVPNITTNTSPGTGFLLFFRGNRSGIYDNPGKMIAPFSAAEDMLVTYNGPINKGDINVNIGYTSYGDAYDGFYLAGNPYPSTIDWDAVRSASNNLNSSITVVTGGKANATYNSVGGISANGGSRYIQPGQGFYIQANSGGGILRFKENQKNIVNTPARLLSAPIEPDLKLTTLNAPATLSNKSASAVSTFSSTDKKILRINLKENDFQEETVVLFDNRYVAEANENDSKYFPGFDVSLSTLSSDNKPMAINLMPAVENVDDMKLSVSAKQYGDMSLTFTEVDFGDSKELWLQDNYLNTLTQITQGSVYNFSIVKTVATSYGDNRFKLLFKPPTTLPVKLLTFEVNKNNNGVGLNFTTSKETNNKGFDIERAGDQNQNFSKIGFVDAKINPQTINNYNFIDAYPLQGNNYYRLKQIDNDGKFEYSEIKSLRFDFNNQQQSILIYPNPAKDFIKVTLPSGQLGAVKMNIINLNGATVKSEKYKAGQELTQDISNLKSGMYLLEIRDENEGLLGVNKFIKK
ncbi:T9SS type A sorting domain-containing protein [Pedobacter sp. SD-b]|uniref:T9SS type A sorting domain-containing protein n=1 Tax=Pedobacter segetis TaxID=2793069 RepID=A0ABS1BH17_9SPHI|nr:T9SS type A sorting domain-containing protein [Pedobacter segetis]MBK0382122.1 T9SS type A sorting domain-containing protein [Pedobacter segetis]